MMRNLPPSQDTCSTSSSSSIIHLLPWSNKHKHRKQQSHSQGSHSNDRSKFQDL